MSARILIVEDDTVLRVSLADLLGLHGYQVQSAADAYKSLPKLGSFAPDLLLVDLHLPGMDGLELMRRSHEDDPSRPVVLMTADRDFRSAMTAIRSGAAHYLGKPFPPNALLDVLAEALQGRPAGHPPGHVSGAPIDGLIGDSAPMRALARTVRLVAPSRATVMVTGETGTGKEAVATALHHLSTRARGPLVKLHCGSLAESVIESELFGHERGAFTDAVSRHQGKLEQADGGTLFLDEIGEISPAIQIKLLRFLQERELERVGGTETLRVDTRIVAATNRDLMAEIKHGRFREDLYYRLNVVPVEVAPLRARPDDIPLLAAHFLAAEAESNAKAVAGFSDPALASLVHHRWPGNVRELQNVIQHAVVMARGPRVELEDLPSSFAEPELEDGPAPMVPGATLAELERFAILETLKKTGGHKVLAARLLGISHHKLQDRLREYAAARDRR